MDQVLARKGVESVRVQDPWKFLQGIATGFLLGNRLEVPLDRAVLRDAGEVGFDFLDFCFGKEAACDGVAVLRERGFHFIQINGGGKCV